jgi:hypothetical protein
MPVPLFRKHWPNVKIVAAQALPDGGNRLQATKHQYPKLQ